MGRIAASQKHRYLSFKRKKNRGQGLALFRQRGNKTVDELIRSTVVKQESATQSTCHPVVSTFIPQKPISPGLMLEALVGEKIEEPDWCSPPIKLEQDMAPQIEEAAWRKMGEAAEEEKRLGIGLDEVDTEDVPIPVACYDSWSMGSYMSNNSLSGLAMSNAVDDVKTVLTKCNNGVAPDDDLVRDFMLPLPREEEKCLYTCAAKEMGGFVDGKMDVEAVYGMIKQFHPDKPILIEKGKPILEQCNADVKVEENECDYVFKMATCIKEGRDKLLSTEN